MESGIDPQTNQPGNEICPECGAAWTAGRTCRDYFHQMLYWENEDPARGEVHHLMVLCYHLQHPSLYSAEGLATARELLADLVERGLTTQQIRHDNRERLSSGNRGWTMTARLGNHGRYRRPVAWTMAAADVVAAGPERYRERVREWAESIYKTLKE